MNESPPDIYEFSEFRVDAVKHRLTKRGEIVPLAPKAFETLLYLVRHPGKLLEKEELMQAVWVDTVVEENNLNQSISAIRRVLGERHDEHRFIVTVPGRGYKFVADVRVPGFGFQVQGSVESEIGYYELNNQSESAISDFRLRDEIDSQKNNEPETRNSKSEISQDQNPQSTAQNRKWFFALAALSILAVGATGFYIWRENSKSVSDVPLKTIAILPFKPLVSESRNESLELGMADTLISKLNSSGEIIVRPLNSVRRFTEEGQDIVAVGRELSVDAVLDGNIQTTHDRIRVSLRLISTENGRQLWADQFTDNFTNIFDVQDEISERVAASLRLHLTASATMRLVKHGTDNPEAYRLYLLGRYHVSKMVLPETQKGVSYLKQAIELDPSYALAYAELANAYRTQALAGNLPAREVLPKSKDAAMKALEIDDSLAEAHVMAGHSAMWYDGNWEEAEKQAKRALELEPNNAAAMFLLENLYSFLGRHEEAVAFGKRARELDPLSLIYNSIEAQTLFYAGRIDEALERAMKARDLDDNFWHVHFMLARIYTEKGMYQDAIAEADRAAQIAEHSYSLAVKGFALAKSGAAIEARNVIDELLKRPKKGRLYTNLALIYTGLGDNKKALEHLEKGFEEREGQIDLNVNPVWDDLRSEPRFVELMKRMNFE